ncbi:hypothetical protein [Streptomyces sp. DSM 41634]|uniref:hypothetical protein n=1 Tax=Streptomyces sp. DSM 41634 TaxID=3448656 RepID=UPI002885DE9E|nr:hypothetical protein [Streptomyces sp. DSM 41633]
MPRDLGGAQCFSARAEVLREQQLRVLTSDVRQAAAEPPALAEPAQREAAAPAPGTRHPAPGKAG